MPEEEVSVWVCVCVCFVSVKDCDGEKLRMESQASLPDHEFSENVSSPSFPFLSAPFLPVPVPLSARLVNLSQGACVHRHDCREQRLTRTGVVMARKMNSVFFMSYG